MFIEFGGRKDFLRACVALVKLKFSSPIFCQVDSMSGITFMMDKRVQKTAAVIELRKHEQRDFYDALPAKSRAR